ncbi:hypothetical protein AXK56_16500 [Tsukamurella pulmonis]|uniref:Adenine-specific DNA methylase, N12 class n=2 Tax=Tsukamurella pulmonis TaxID=47312 RepID=A0A1H1A916_9ACTN|nr:hypothetical protein AXK56_16500 [Tsukamurella pulmonis]SDQ36152.1 Adenine-specific DNA methylase, N12 class [Tsukamurella pulmonis]SUQ39426.1 DNA methylase [Tsukamurella pulmonis]
MGVPLSQMTKVRTQEAVRPDGSRVWIEASTVIAGLETDLEDADVDDADDEDQADTDHTVDDGADDAASAVEQHPYVPPRSYAHPGEVTVPSGEKSRVRANIAALELVAQLEEQQRYATPDEQDVLARWSGWGGAPTVFDESRPEWKDDRDALYAVLTDDEIRAAKRSTLNAHYTDPAITTVMWDMLERAGFEGGRVLEPGSGAGTFIGTAPSSATMVGVELDPVSSKIAHYLYPGAQVRNEPFERTRVGDGSFIATIGNVPFGSFSLVDPVHNQRGHSIHNHFILKSMHLTKPGGYLALITSTHTLDTLGATARREMHESAELVGAFRLPANTFRRVAATSVVTDLLVFRRRAEDERVPHPDTVDWLSSDQTELEMPNGAMATVPVNRYFAQHPDHVIGRMHAATGQYGPEMRVDAEDLEQVPARLRQAMAPIIDDAVDRGAGLRAGQVPQETATTPGLATAAELYENEPPIGQVEYDEATGDFYRRGFSGDPELVKVPDSRKVETRHLLRLRTLAESTITSQRAGNVSVDDRNALRRELNRVYDAYVASNGPINRVKVSGGKERTEEQAAAKMLALEGKWRHANRDRETDEPYAGPIPDDTLAEHEEQAWLASPIVRRQIHLEALRGDPGVALLLALERWDEETGKAEKADIFSRDVVAPPRRVATAQTPQEAIAVSVGESAYVDLGRVAELLGVTPDEAREQIRGLAYPDPDDMRHRLQPAEAVVSGQVIKKADRVARLIEDDPGNSDWPALHSALRAAIPTPKGPSQIGDISLGETWVHPNDYAAFAEETFGIDSVIVEHSSVSWTVSTRGGGRYSAIVKTEYGVELNGKSMDAVELFETLLNQRPIVIRNSLLERERGAPEVNGPATTLAQVQARKITAEFQGWLWNDDSRRDRLLGEWNRRFNGFVAPKYDGRYLQLPDVSAAFTAHSYQRNAVARIAAEPTVLLDHVVGAGKTGSMFMGAMELKRRGLVNQPWIVVPTHLIEQFGREVKQWLPAANVLVGRKGMDVDARRLLVAQSATSNWDMVIVPSSVFELISVAPERQQKYIEDQIASLEEEQRRMKAAKGSDLNPATTKALERMKVRLESRLEKLANAAKKDGEGRVTFEQTGCDYLFVDEAHDFKNKSRISSVESLSHPGSQKAEDLALKLSVLREGARNRAAAEGRFVVRGAERVACFSTGTPIANSLAEAWVMQSYLRPDLLADAGVDSINDWGASFTTTRSETVTNTTGTKLKVVTRVAAFKNPREMFAITSQFTDVVIRAQVDEETGGKLPKAGGREIITTPSSQEFRDFSADLEYRLDNADPARPDLDNTLKVLGDGRKAALDPRLARMDPPAPGFSRAYAVAERVASIHHEYAERTYLGPNGEVSPIPGALQLVFCDLGTPKPNGGWSLYDAMRDEMVARGIPAEAIAYIHQAKTAAQRSRLQAACVSGRISVLIGSTAKMGTGMNVQARLVALHHVDVPWRPADLEQREGRIIRQGNQHSQVHICSYVSEASTDTVMWAKVESKAMFIEQAKNGQLDDNVTSIEDVEEQSLVEAAAATKAAATGDPRFMELVESEEKLKELRALEGAHREARFAASHRVRHADHEIPLLEDRIEVYRRVVDENLTGWDAKGKPFTVAGRAFVERTDRSAALLDRARSVYVALKGQGAMRSEVIATMPGDIDVRMNRPLESEMIRVWLDMPGEPALSITKKNLFGEQTLLDDGGESSSAMRSGFATRIENLYASLPDRIPTTQTMIDDYRDDIVVNSPKIDAPFEEADELRDLEVTVHRLRTEIAAEQNTPEAIARRTAADARMKAAGRRHGWSLQLNPTKKMVEESDYANAEDYAAAARRMHQYEAARYARDHGGVTRPAAPTPPPPTTGDRYAPPRSHDSASRDDDGLTR